MLFLILKEALFYNNMKKLIPVFFLLAWMSPCAAQKPAVSYEESIRTIYPTKDWVISDFFVTDVRFGARAEAGFDNRAAFQAAIDAAYMAGGGVVYVPAGHYEFHSTQIGNRQVRVRKGDTEEKKDYTYRYVLSLPSGVQLRGDWADPALHQNQVAGTVLEVRVGKDSPAYDATIKSWWNDSQNGNVLHSSYTSIADRFIELNACTGVTNLSIWYPEQDVHDVHPYPWTLFQTRGDNATIERVTLVNAYNGFMSAPSELHYMKNCYMTALNKGVEVHVCTDIGRIEDVHIHPAIWAESGLPGAPSLEEVRDYTLENGLGFRMHRSDWEYVSGLDISGYKTGVWIGKEPGFKNAPNAQFFNLNVRDCHTALFVEEVNPYGILITNSIFGSIAGGQSVYFHPDFGTSVQFNGVDINGQVVSDGHGGVISFENCTFEKLTTPAIQLSSGNLLLTQCDFKQKKKHVCLGSDALNLKSINCGELDVIWNHSSANVECRHDQNFYVKPVEKGIVTESPVYPRPATNRILKVDFARETAYDNQVPSADISVPLQTALNQIGMAGGGTLYLPAGRYLVEKPVTIPAGVELRGSWDVPHHTQGGGTAIFTNYDGGKAGANGPSLIQLKEGAGLNGLTFVQLNLLSDGFNLQHPRSTPFLIQGQGKGVYVVNTTIAVGDKGIDLASYNTSGHYINCLGGILLRAGVQVGGGAKGGFIRNIQFNPHYSQRLPRGGQGYPYVKSTQYVQSHCNALKFADVRNQTIFNNFVFGSVYGIHFLKDAVTGNYPGKMTMVGHGSDGCTYALFVEDADEHTRIVGVNSELVNTRIILEPVRSYVLIGSQVGDGRIHPDAQLILYNSAFWGSPVIGSIINGGQLHLHQANFHRTGNPGIDVRGGKAFIYTSYFAQKKVCEGDYYIYLSDTTSTYEQFNNYFSSPDRILFEK